jgi:hypothetical protein
VTSVRPVATSFRVLLDRGYRSGFLALVQPPTFEEQCAEQRVLRDLEIRTAALCGRRGPNRKTVVATSRVRELHDQGLSIREIAEETGLQRGKPSKYHCPSMPCERPTPKKKTEPDVGRRAPCPSIT